MPRPLARLLALLAVAVLALGACGDDDDTVAAPDDGDTTTSTETTEAETTEPETDTTRPASGEDLCAVLEDIVAFQDQFGDEVDDMDGRQVDQLMSDLNEHYERAAAEAPADMVPHFEVISEGIEEFRAVIAEFDFDEDAMDRAYDDDPERFDNMQFGGMDFIQASMSIEQYGAEHCGIE